MNIKQTLALSASAITIASASFAVGSLTTEPTTVTKTETVTTEVTPQACEEYVNLSLALDSLRSDQLTWSTEMTDAALNNDSGTFITKMDQLSYYLPVAQELANELAILAPQCAELTPTKIG